MKVLITTVPFAEKNLLPIEFYLKFVQTPCFL